MKLQKLMRRNLGRRPLRTTLTVGGVAFAVLLLVLVESLAQGLDHAVSGSEAARTLIVYRQNRYCPQTSFLPQAFEERVAGIAGIESVLPVKIFLSNCRASLDVVAFQGVPAGDVFAARKIDLVAGDRADFESRGDGAIVGQAFAARRHLGVGDKFRFGSIDVQITGIFRSPEPIEENLILTHLDFLQRAGPVNKLGTVTEFEVKVTRAEEARRIAGEIDRLLATSEAPTDTRLKQAFIESATADLREILRFGRMFGLGCVVVVLLLVANTVAMAVHERVREMAVMRTLGFHDAHLVLLVLGESLLLALSGAALGTAAALTTIQLARLTIGVEGVLIGFTVTAALILKGLAIAAGAGLLAGLLPALRVARADISATLRGT